jgi:uncharacterized protein YunC (DUF1805 family)
MNSEDLTFALARPLLILKKPKGFLACAYINVETANKTGEACAIVSGVNNYDDMKVAKIIAVSNAAISLGVSIGDSGEAALKKFE